eukprot:7902230-Pyramimonas_sp.AAC.1
MRLNHVSFAGAEGGADLAGVPASVVASVTSPALAGDAVCPAGVAIETAAVPIIIAVRRLSSSRRSLRSFAPRSITIE